jgi:hypothetical protein
MSDREKLLAEYIKSQIDRFRSDIVALEEKIKNMQELCPHPEFEEGISIVACVMPVEICTICSYVKYPSFASDDEVAEFEERHD